MIHSTPDAKPAITLEWLDRTRNQLLLASPFYLLVPVLFYVAYQAMGVTPSWKLMGAGALGWFVALTLRGPIAILAQKFASSQEKGGLWVAASSGPLEEVVRLLVLLWLGRDFPTALAIGLGWASIEVAFALFNSLLGNMLLRGDDPKVVEAREMLAQQINTDNGPWWGVIERISASACHIGNTLLIALFPLATLVVAPLHTALNLGVVRLTRTSILLCQVFLAVAGALTLGLGLAFFALH